MLPGTAFLKGNLYFKKYDSQSVAAAATAAKEEDEEDKNESRQQAGRWPIDEAENEDEDDDENGGEDTFMKMKNQEVRYFNDENPTIKCKNCKNYGHWASVCPNDTKRDNCILCGNDSHDSFSCDTKLCFRCNKGGHSARDCKEKNIIICTCCEQAGHRENRCLKKWTGNYAETELGQARCCQCG